MSPDATEYRARLQARLTHLFEQLEIWRARVRLRGELLDAGTAQRLEAVERARQTWRDQRARLAAEKSKP